MIHLVAVINLYGGICWYTLWLWIFASHWIGDLLLVTSLIQWLSAVLDCFVLDIEHIFAGDSGLERPDLGLQLDYSRLGQVLEFSLRVWMSFAGAAVGSEDTRTLYATFLGLHYDRELCQGCLPALYLKQLGWSCLETHHWCDKLQNHLIIFHCTIVTGTCCSRTSYC